MSTHISKSQLERFAVGALEDDERPIAVRGLGAFSWWDSESRAKGNLRYSPQKHAEGAARILL